MLRSEIIAMRNQAIDQAINHVDRSIKMEYSKLMWSGAPLRQLKRQPTLRLDPKRNLYLPPLGDPGRVSSLRVL